MEASSWISKLLSGEVNTAANNNKINANNNSIIVEPVRLQTGRVMALSLC